MWLWIDFKHCTYSVSSLETTIFCQTRQIFRSTFLSSYLNLYFPTLIGGNSGCVLPPIRVSKYGVNQELRKVDLKITLTKEIISRKIVVSRLETLYWQDFAWFHMKLLKLWELGMTWIFQFRTELKSDSVKWETLLSSVNLHWTITSEKLTTDWDKTKIKKTYNWGR